MTIKVKVLFYNSMRAKGYFFLKKTIKFLINNDKKIKLVFFKVMIIRSIK